MRETTFGQSQSMLDDARRAIRLADYAEAETLLERSLMLRNREAAEYFNLMGALQESRKRWRKAKKCYLMAIGILENYEPARLNLQRLTRCRAAINQDIRLGDEDQGIWYAQLAKG